MGCICDTQVYQQGKMPDADEHNLVPMLQGVLKDVLLKNSLLDLEYTNIWNGHSPIVATVAAVSFIANSTSKNLALWNISMTNEPTAQEIWHALLNGEFSWDKDRRRFMRLPAKHRCKNCYAPFDGIGAIYARRVGRLQYERNPRFCTY